eukprot:RCo025110
MSEVENSALAPEVSHQVGSGSSDGSRDSKMLSAPSRSLNAKRLRMAAENDVQFLANRIAKLKAEELKAKREIEKTVSKTKEILSNRKTFESRAVDKLQIREQISTSKKEERVLVSLNKDKQLKAIWVAKQKLLNEKKEACSSIRKQKEINECRMHIMKEEDRERNMKRREDIKQQQVQTKLLREREHEEKQEAIRKLYEEKIAVEEQERDRKEKLAAQLVAQEAQLIYRLKQLHGEKQKAIRDLATAVDVVRADEIEEEIEGLDDEAGDPAVPQEIDEDSP